MSEIRIHNSLKHPNIVAFDHFFEDKDNIYILLEMCSNRTLNELLIRRKRLTELEAKCYLIQLISGLKYIHTNNIIHRDLKLRNLFLTDKMELKIGDFGLAAKTKYGDKRKTVCGTPNYMAPEIITGNGHCFEVDVWALGIILYVLLVGRLPFETPDVDATYARIQSVSYTFPSELSISHDAKDLVSKILCLDPSKRPSLDQMLSHKFISGYAIPKLMPISSLVCPPSEFFTKTCESSYETIKQNLKKRQSITSPPQAGSSPLSEFEVHVKSWLHHYNYGFGYLMSNDCIGVTFNDENRLLFHPVKQ